MATCICERCKYPIYEDPDTLPRFGEDRLILCETCQGEVES